MQREITPTSIKNQAARQITAASAGHWPFISLLVAIIFGFVAGFLGQIISQSYPLSWPYASAILSQFNLVDDDILVIHSANLDSRSQTNLQKVLEQNHAAVYNLYPAAAGLYSGAERRTAALALTNDGWLVTSATNLPAPLVLVSHEQKVYPVEKILFDSYSGLTFLKTSEHNLTTSAFVEPQTMQIGDPVFSYFSDPAFGTNLFPLYLTNLNYSPALLQSSDHVADYYLVSADLPAEFSSSPVFNYAGQVVGLPLADRQILTGPDIQLRLDYLLGTGEFKALAWGVSYYDLSRTVNLDPSLTQGLNKGILVQNLTGIKTELKVNDIIQKVGDLEINSADNFNRELLAALLTGSADLTIYRDGSTQEITIAQ